MRSRIGVLVIVIAILFSGAGCCNVPRDETGKRLPRSAPPAPRVVAPKDKDVVACAPTVAFGWKIVPDPDGIVEYQVEVERAPLGVEWEPLDGSPWTGVTVTALAIDARCGYYYRWRVRAVDGAGNVGPFTDWFTFNMPEE